MGFIGSIIGNDDGGDQEDPDTQGGYRVVARDPETKSQAKIPKQFRGGKWVFEEPPSKQQFYFEYGDYLKDDREYICAPQDGSFVDLDNVNWSIKPQDTGAKQQTPEEERDAKLEKKIDRLEEKMTEEQKQKFDPEEITTQLQAQAVAYAMQSGEFWGRHGEKVALAALDVPMGGQSSIDYEDFQSDPVGSMFFDLSQNPEKARDLGENLGGGLGAALDGFIQGAGDGVTPSERNGEEPSQDDGEAWEPSQLDAGPRTLGELEAGEDSEAEDVAREISDLVREKRQAEQRQQQPSETARESDAGHADPTDHGGDPGEIEAEEQRQAEMSPDHYVQDPPEDGDVTTEPARDEGVTAEPAEPSDATDKPDTTVTEEPDPDVTAEPAPEGEGTRSDQDLDPKLCQHIKDDGEQCGLPPQDGSDYCHVEGHGPSDTAGTDSEGGEDTDGDADEKIMSLNEGMEAAKEEINDG